jgi:hypothetical protein
MLTPEYAVRWCWFEVPAMHVLCVWMHVVLA